jgi:ketosteroid isomerase-like protein
MSLDKNKAITSRFWEEVFNRRNLDVIANLVTKDYVFHGSAGKEVRGREGLKQFLIQYCNQDDNGV